MDSGDTDLHTLAGAYAMDAVADGDRARFERHLAGCGACREEIRGLHEATARLATAATVVPRPELREQTLRAAALIRQLPPAVREDIADRGGIGIREGSTIREGSAARDGGARRVARESRPRGWRTIARWMLPGIAVAAAGALVAVTVLFGAMMHGTQHQLDQAQRGSHAIAAVLNAADVTMLTAHVTTGGSATIVMSRRQRALVFTARGLQALTPGRHYELWLMGPAGARSAGPLPVARAGMVGPTVIAGLQAGDKVGLTVEHAASSRPTAPMLLLLGLAPR
jgi:Anti-sigma-K factor rskA/Putative zinc-finger